MVWLDTGITELCITGEGEYAPISLISWIIGPRCRLPLQLEMPSYYQIAATSLLLAPETMPLLQQRLTSLTCNTTSEALSSGIFTLTSLTALQLYDTNLLDIIAHEAWETPRLNVLKLSKCKMQFAALLGAVAMPRLRSLLVHSTFQLPVFSQVSLNALTLLTTLRTLQLRDCSLVVLPPLANLKYLEELDFNDNTGLDDVQPALRAATALSKLTAWKVSMNDAFLGAVASVTSLTHVDVRTEFRTTPLGCHFLSRLSAVLSRRPRWCLLADHFVMPDILY